LRLSSGNKKGTRAEARVPVVDRSRRTVRLEGDARDDAEDPRRDDGGRLDEASEAPVAADGALNRGDVEQREGGQRELQTIPATAEHKGLRDARVEQVGRLEPEVIPVDVLERAVTDRPGRSAVDRAGAVDRQGTRGALGRVEVRRGRDVPRELIAA